MIDRETTLLQRVCRCTDRVFEDQSLMCRSTESDGTSGTNYNVVRWEKGMKKKIGIMNRKGICDIQYISNVY